MWLVALVLSLPVVVLVGFVTLPLAVVPVWLEIRHRRVGCAAAAMLGYGQASLCVLGAATVYHLLDQTAGWPLVLLFVVGWALTARGYRGSAVETGHQIGLVSGGAIGSYGLLHGQAVVSWAVIGALAAAAAVGLMIPTSALTQKRASY